MTDAMEGEGTWGKLRRRKVVQWGIAYAAGAWGLLQGVAYMRDTFGWLHQVQQTATVLLLIGLPIVLVLAWYHGDRGEQRVSGTELAILTLLFVLGGGLFWRFQGPSETHGTARSPAVAPREAQAPAAATTDARPSIAVLPFENRSRLEDDAFFVDGIHDDILTQLTKVSAMKVISRTSVEPFRKTELSLQQIAQRLGVSKILEGGVQRAGNRVRINVQLIDASTDAHLWAESYDRELTAANIFAIQTEVATAIAAALEATLTPAEKARVNEIPTQNLEAWEAYQLGRQRMAKRASEALVEAEKFFQRAIDLDPKFALAWVGLADTLRLQIDNSGAPEKPLGARIEKAIAEALELDPNLAEAWTSSAAVAADKEQYDRAEHLYLRAIRLNPNYATAHHWYSMLLNDLGRNDEALSEARKAVELDPLSAIANMNLGAVLAYLGRPEEAEACFRKAMEIEPSMPGTYIAIGGLKAYALNQPADALPYLQKARDLDPGSPGPRMTLAYLYLDLGADAEATRLIEDARRHWPDHPFVLRLSPFAHLYQGEPQAALEDAHLALAMNPRTDIALFLLRNADLQAGHPEVARARYAKAFPEFFAATLPKNASGNVYVMVDIALVLQRTGEGERANTLLDLAEALIRPLARLGSQDYGIVQVEIDVIRGQKQKALKGLRELAREGWRGPVWRYYRDFDPALASIRNEPEFKAVFADIERDMAAQRAKLAARPKDAPLDLGPAH